MTQYLYYIPVLHIPASQNEELGRSLCYHISKFAQIIVWSNVTITTDIINPGQPIPVLALRASAKLHEFLTQKNIGFLYHLGET